MEENKLPQAPASGVSVANNQNLPAVASQASTAAVPQPQNKEIEEKLRSDNKNIVHGVRMIAEAGMIAAFSLSHSPYLLPLSALVVSNEIISQVLIYLSKINGQIKKVAPYIYVLSSVSTISISAYFTGWVLNDFYLIYLIHISSATVGYGLKVGLFSSFLATLTYAGLLYVFAAPSLVYLRLPILGILILRLLVTQRRYEKIEGMLNNILSVEKAKGDFISIASHNLRTPVAAIYGYIDLLIRGDSGKLNDDQASYLKKIKNNNSELERLTEQLLQISILEVGKEVNLFKQPSQIETVIDGVVDNLASVASGKGLEMAFKKGNYLLPLVDIDVEKIKAVLVNLIDNAIKYTDKGKIEIQAKEEGNFIAVSIIDSGSGISKEDLPKLFTKFFRTGNILVYNKVGTGLGLYLGKKIIELHGGDIRVESIEGVGSTFTFTVPIAKADDNL